MRNKVILDAAIGAAEATVHWAKLIHEQGGTSRIIAVDNDLDEKWRGRVHDTLGEFNKYVEFHDADIFDLNFIAGESIDIVNCDDTVVFLNDPPLKVLDAFKEFKRVLRPAGLLFITSETPISLTDDPSHEGQWRRWQFAKAVSALKGEVWSSEPPAATVRTALELLGFDVYGHREFAPHRYTDDQLEGWMGEWRDDLGKDIDSVPWPSLKDPLRRAADEVRDKVLSDGYFVCPPMYVLKCRKGKPA